LQVTQAPLRLDRELPHGLDFVAEQLDPVGGLGIRRVNVEDATAAAKLAGDLDRLHALKAMLDQPGAQLVQVHRVADAQCPPLPGQLLPVRYWLQEGLEGSQQVARRLIVFELLEHAQALAGNLIEDGVGRGQRVPGGEDDRPSAGEANEVFGPAVEVARVGQDD
jgi:hypothetical protein